MLVHQVQSLEVEQIFCERDFEGSLGSSEQRVISSDGRRAQADQASS